MPGVPGEKPVRVEKEDIPVRMKVRERAEPLLRYRRAQFTACDRVQGALQLGDDVADICVRRQPALPACGGACEKCGR